jgi:hypothetical protein
MRKANSKEQFRKRKKENPKSKQRSFFGQLSHTHTHTHMFRVFQEQHVWYRTAITTYQQAKRNMREASSKQEKNKNMNKTKWFG